MVDEPLAGRSGAGRPSESAQDGSAPGSVTAGTLLRRAREAQGLHIAALAASLKVPPRKLEALERDRHDELPDASFARALALTVCRALKTDPAPVLALMPRVGPGTLDQVSAGLNTPFRDHATGAGDPVMASLTRHPAALIVALLLVAALAMWFWPRAAVEPAPVAQPEPAVPTAALPPVMSVPAAEPAASQGADPLPDPATSAAAASAPGEAPPTPAEAPTATTAVAPVAGLLSLRVREDSWVQVVDATGRLLVSRTVAAGTELTLDGTPPLRLTIGNASATEVVYRGRTLDLVPSTVGNVVRIELK